MTFGGDGGNYADAKNRFDFDQFYQEFQFSADAGGSVNWLVGVNAFIEEAKDRNTSSFWYVIRVCFVRAQSLYSAWRTMQFR